MRARSLALLLLINAVVCRSVRRDKDMNTDGITDPNTHRPKKPHPLADTLPNHTNSTLKDRAYISSQSCPPVYIETIDKVLGAVANWALMAYWALTGRVGTFQALVISNFGDLNAQEEQRLRSRYLMIEKEARFMTRGRTIIDCHDPWNYCASIGGGEGYVTVEENRIHLVILYFLMSELLLSNG